MLLIHYWLLNMHCRSRLKIANASRPIALLSYWCYRFLNRITLSIAFRVSSIWNYLASFIGFKSNLFLITIDRNIVNFFFITWNRNSIIIMFKLNIINIGTLLWNVFYWALWYKVYGWAFKRNAFSPYWKKKIKRLLAKKAIK